MGSTAIGNDKSWVLVWIARNQVYFCIFHRIIKQLFLDQLRIFNSRFSERLLDFLKALD
jgi:hypothetical protein